MAISETDVKNAALALVGEEPMSSGTDDSKAQRYSKLLYEFARNECFDMRVNWAFAKARAELAALDDEPTHGSYDYQFLLPANCRRVRRLHSSTDDDTENAFVREVYVNTSGSREIEQAVVLSNESVAYIDYTRLITDPNRWPAYFTHLVYVRLAVLLCEPLRQDKRKKHQLLEMYKDALDNAKADNGAESMEVSGESIDLDKGNTDVTDAASDEEPDEQYIQIRAS